MIGGKKASVGIVPSVTGPGDAGRGGGFLMPSKDANLALVVRRNKCEPISGPNLPFFLSVVICFVSVKSRKVAAVELVFSPVDTRHSLWRYRIRTAILIEQRSIIFT